MLPTISQGNGFYASKVMDRRIDLSRRNPSCRVVFSFRA